MQSEHTAHALISSTVIPGCPPGAPPAVIRRPGAVLLCRRVESAAVKQIWNRSTLCHKFLHSTDFFPSSFLPICELKRWAGLRGRRTGGEWRCKPLQLCLWHRHVRCMTLVAASNIYTLTCVSLKCEFTPWIIKLLKRAEAENWVVAQVATKVTQSYTLLNRRKRLEEKWGKCVASVYSQFYKNTKKTCCNTEDFVMEIKTVNIFDVKGIEP